MAVAKCQAISRHFFEKHMFSIDGFSELPAVLDVKSGQPEMLGNLSPREGKFVRWHHRCNIM
jgi:hypothetical protein